MAERLRELEERMEKVHGEINAKSAEKVQLVCQLAVVDNDLRALERSERLIKENINIEKKLISSTN